MRLAALPSAAVALTLGAAVACASREDPPVETPPPPDPGVTLEGGVRDARDDVPGPQSGCSESGFCYVPVPEQRPLIAVSASGADDAWMLPEQSGTLLRWNGTEVKEVYRYEGTSPSAIYVRGIWAEKKDDVWAVADGSDGPAVFVRYAPPASGGPPEFRELRTEETFFTRALWGTATADALWIATGASVLRVHEAESGAVVEHMDPGVGAEDVVDRDWHAVWGFAPEDVYVAGSACLSAGCQDKERRGVIAHYDGSEWSILTIDGAKDVLSLQGTRPGADRRLWYSTVEPEEDALGGVEFVVHSYLVPASGGSLGAPLFQHSIKNPPACSSRLGYASTAASGWFSDGLLLCHWTGTSLESASTIVDGRPRIHSLNDVWANEADEAWIVGTAIARTNLPQGPFAARRTATTAKGEGQ